MDEGMFPIRMRGFDRDDVLAYIDAIQAKHREETAQLTEKYDELKRRHDELQTSFESEKSADADAQRALAERIEAAVGLESKLAEAGGVIRRLEQEKAALAQQLTSQRDAAENSALSRRQLDEARAEGQRLAARLADMEAKYNALQGNSDGLAARAAAAEEMEREIRLLREQKQWHAAERDKDLARVQEADDRIRQLHDEIGALTARLGRAEDALAGYKQRAGEVDAARARYNAFSEDVGHFLVELHNTGRTALDSAYRRSESCVEAAEEAVETLWHALTQVRGELEEARGKINDQRVNAAVQLRDMMDSVTATASAVSDPAAPVNPDAPESPDAPGKDGQSEGGDVFFR